jgi:hypothetical protein
VGNRKQKEAEAQTRHYHSQGKKNASIDSFPLIDPTDPTYKNSLLVRRFWFETRVILRFEKRNPDLGADTGTMRTGISSRNIKEKK